MKLAVVALTGAVIVCHIRRPDLRVPDPVILALSLAVVGLGVALASRRSARPLPRPAHP